MKNNIETTLKNELLNKNSAHAIFKNEKYLSKNYFPPVIEFRNGEFHQLAVFFKEIYNMKENFPNVFQTVTIYGPVGCGKSTVAKIFGKELENFGKINNLPFRIIYQHINCRRNNSIFLILFNLLRNLIPNFPNRGFSSIELINMLHIVLNTSKSYLILALDEIDFIFHDKELDLFFHNIAFEPFENDSILEKRISLIFITRNKDFLLLVDANNKFGINNNLIKFENYSQEELKKILFQKSNESFNEGILPLKTLEFIVEISNELRDLRTSIELLWKAGKNCEFSNSSFIEEDHVKEALKMILFSNISIKLEFNEGETILLKCLYKHSELFKINQPLNLKKLKKLLINESTFFSKNYNSALFSIIV